MEKNKLILAIIIVSVLCVGFVFLFVAITKEPTIETASTLDGQDFEEESFTDFVRTIGEFSIPESAILPKEINEKTLGEYYYEEQSMLATSVPLENTEINWDLTPGYPFPDGEGLSWNVSNVDILHQQEVAESEYNVNFSVMFDVERKIAFPDDQHNMKEPLSMKANVRFENLNIRVRYTEMGPVFSIPKETNDRVGQFFLTWNRGAVVQPTFINEEPVGDYDDLLYIDDDDPGV